ncbi:MAG TPA: LanC-like protein [Steroidobacteraceae bacterium]|nr:LanC-like protein [Steroidobacteraceae bacterium]
MIYDAARHEPVQSLEWNEDRARRAIHEIVADAEQAFTPERYWSPHPKDADGIDSGAFTPLYHGALGVIWALQHLRDLGAAALSRDYAASLPRLQQDNRRWLDAQGNEATPAAFLMGDTPFLLMRLAAQPGAVAQADELERLIAGNLEHPSRELMWGSPGTLLAALFMHERTGADRWAVRFRSTARTLWSQLQWSEQFGVRYWTQDLYGRQSTYLDAVHGFVATALPLIRGRGLLEPAEWDAWQECIVNTIGRTATWQGPHVNWRAFLVTPEGGSPRFLMQFCHGAPGFVVCLGALPSDELDPLLAAAGETIWSAGPLTKGSNLCHGTGGNGYAFLALHQRSGERRWLDRARAFAMHGIAQTQADRARYGQGRYSLWTGDVGFAIYLWHCIEGTAAFPTLDVF